MKTTKLSKSKFKETTTPKMHNVTETAEPVLDIWPYVDAVPAEDLGGHAVKDVEFVYRSEDDRFEHVLIATATKNVYLCIIVDIANTEILGHYFFDLNAEYGLTTADSEHEAATNGFTCRSCGQFHAELPMDFGADAPVAYYGVPENERQARCDLSSDLCVIDKEHFFIRGCLEIQVVDGPRPFAWGVWTSLSKENFKRTVQMWETSGRENEPPYFGWLCTALPLYPTTLNLKTHVHTRPLGERPLVELEPTDHPLAVEQRNGITMDRVREIAENLLHGGDDSLSRRKDR